MTEHMTAEQLLPCPFCGSPAGTDEIPHGHSRYFIECTNGDCPVEPFVNARSLVEAKLKWNTRPA